MLALVLASLVLAHQGVPASDLGGAWQTVRQDGTVGTWIMSDSHFSIAWYKKDPNKFVSTEGGTWAVTHDGLKLMYEFDTANPQRVGNFKEVAVKLSNGVLRANGESWKRLDAGSPGALEGAWLMTGRVRDGQASNRTPGARRTMKILSGTRFQWIAYNVETKEFFGTGGGTYGTANGKYTENIEFFSRDDAKAGRILEFEYDLGEDGIWNHVGKSTAGEPMHELWQKRTKLGI